MIPWLKKQGGGERLFLDHVLPRAPTLSSAYAFINYSFFRHPLGFSMYDYKFPKGRVEKVPAWRGKPLAYITVFRTGQGRPTSVRMSGSSAAVADVVRRILSFASSIADALVLYSETVLVSIMPVPVTVPLNMFQQKGENIYIPGFESYIHILDSEMKKEDRCLIVDWEREAWDERVKASKMALAIAKVRETEGGDGRVVYVFAVNLNNLRKVW